MRDAAAPASAQTQAERPWERQRARALAGCSRRRCGRRLRCGARVPAPRHGRWAWIQVCLAPRPPHGGFGAHLRARSRLGWGVTGRRDGAAGHTGRLPCMHAGLAACVRLAGEPVAAVRQPSGALGGARRPCGSLWPHRLPGWRSQARSESREPIPHPTTAREQAGKRSSPAAVAECAPPRGTDPTCACRTPGRPCPERRLCMRSAARDRQRSRSVRPPRRADGAAG